MIEQAHGMRTSQDFGEYYQVDLPNLVGLEVVLRRCQTIECNHEKQGKAASHTKAEVHAGEPLMSSRL